MLPKVIIHTSLSLDGRVEGFQADVERFYRIAARWREDATLTGSEAILAAPDLEDDDEKSAQSSARVHPCDTRPLLVVVDSRGRVKRYNGLRNLGYWRDAVALCTPFTPAEHLEYLKALRVATIITGTHRVDLKASLRQLKDRFGVNTIRVDNGGTLASSLLRSGLVHEVSVLIHPALVGGETPRPFLKAPDPAGRGVAIPLRLVRVESFDKDLVWLSYEVRGNWSRQDFVNRRPTRKDDGLL